MYVHMHTHTLSHTQVLLASCSPYAPKHNTKASPAHKKEAGGAKDGGGLGEGRGGVRGGDVGVGLVDGAQGEGGNINGTPGKTRMKLSFEKPRLSRYFKQHRMDT
jgi:hypothetical protein